MANMAWHCHPLCITRHRNRNTVCSNAKLLRGFEDKDSFDFVFDDDLVVELQYPKGARMCGCWNRSSRGGIPYHTVSWAEFCHDKVYSEMCEYEEKLDEEHNKWLTVKKAREEAKAKMSDFDKQKMIRNLINGGPEGII